FELLISFDEVLLPHSQTLLVVQFSKNNLSQQPISQLLSFSHRFVSGDFYILSLRPFEVNNFFQLIFLSCFHLLLPAS
ncbi:hypothetical protein M5X00_29795, partial [Paenibacillus alvei]|uniref:hypothetical protein n=1 Tax=Paenibacillus alvei TaxID=44250 RepID=UPI0022811F89